MRIFIGYGYHQRDLWIEDLVFDLVRASGFEPVDGKELYGQGLSEGIRGTIAQCQGVLGFTTKREDANGNQDGTHRWVIEELLIADGLGKPSIEIIELGLTQMGSRVGRQHIVYDPNNRERVLIELVKALGRWRNNLPILVRLVPDEIIKEIRPNLGMATLQCTYKVYRDGNESEPREGKLRKMQGGVCVEIQEVDGNCLISLSISFGNKVWESGFDSLYRTINLEGQ
jgi:hypothetical protein